MEKCYAPFRPLGALARQRLAVLRRCGLHHQRSLLCVWQHAGWPASPRRTRRHQARRKTLPYTGCGALHPPLPLHRHRRKGTGAELPLLGRLHRAFADDGAFFAIWSGADFGVSPLFREGPPFVTTVRSADSEFSAEDMLHQKAYLRTAGRNAETVLALTVVLSGANSKSFAHRHRPIRTQHPNYSFLEALQKVFGCFLEALLFYTRTPL